MADAENRPLIGWDLHSAAENLIVLDLQTASDAAERQAVIDGIEPTRHLKAAMTPKQCLELSEDLMRQALALMAKRPRRPF